MQLSTSEYMTRFHFQPDLGKKIFLILCTPAEDISALLRLLWAGPRIVGGIKNSLK